MLLTSVIIILRETLEAAALIAILLALGRRHGMRVGWSGFAAAFGLLGAGLMSHGYAELSEWFDGVGYEVVNASLQLAIYLLIVAVIWQLATRRAAAPAALMASMAAAVALAMAREGSEILLYAGSVGLGNAQGRQLLLGALIGGAIGLSIGVAFYYLLLAFPADRSRRVGLGLLLIFGAGMCGQAAMLLIQADWLPNQPSMWDSSGWLPESSVAGQLLYALVGYEATPSTVQVAIYAGALLIGLLAILLGHLSRRPQGVQDAI